ncbi:hypothetical protein LEP1GSC050_0278 [Leptospira broomii serovar Hurstbridge str. 5399]|uniref:Alpha/beta hydrolase domain protein n=1 Tax=Leptospira broomii serovar Hurstbridge str. 5399 TaxID=1049789 RepID=T0FF35_9LEPT|nr:hypothetical protein [Leptospira broomii]EQA46486.1 hypothetical protein LEP1GSC050_0278 [Leptospira broomii serovar Hurstbridge str. 5399]
MKKTFASLREFYYYIVEIFSFLFSLATCYLPETRETPIEQADILIVPGFFSGPVYYKKLTRNLEKAGYKPKILKVPPIFLSTTNIIRSLDSQLKNLPKKYVFLTHNTGGLLCLLLPDTSRRKVGALITLGTPFRGTSLFRFFGPKDLDWKSPLLEKMFNTFLFMDRFQPLSPWKELFFLPKSSSEFGQGRDLWFDVVGNFNIVRVEENLRSITDYLEKNHPPGSSLEHHSKSDKSRILETEIPEVEKPSKTKKKVRRTEIKKPIGKKKVQPVRKKRK